MHENHPPPATAAHNNNVHPRTYLIHLPIPSISTTYLHHFNFALTWGNIPCRPFLSLRAVYYFFRGKAWRGIPKRKNRRKQKRKKGKGEKRFKDGGRRTDLRTSLERTDQTEHGVIFRTIAIATRYRTTLPGRF